MGLLPPEGVRPVPVLSDIEAVDATDPEAVTLKEALSTVTIERIVAKHRVRKSAHADAWVSEERLAVFGGLTR